MHKMLTELVTTGTHSFTLYMKQLGDDQVTFIMFFSPSQSWYRAPVGPMIMLYACRVGPLQLYSLALTSLRPTLSGQGIEPPVGP